MQSAISADIVENRAKAAIKTPKTIQRCMVKKKIDRNVQYVMPDRCTHGLACFVDFINKNSTFRLHVPLGEDCLKTYPRVELRLASSVDAFASNRESEQDIFTRPGITHTVFLHVTILWSCSQDRHLRSFPVRGWLCKVFAFCSPVRGRSCDFFPLVRKTSLTDTNPMPRVRERRRCGVSGTCWHLPREVF